MGNKAAFLNMGNCYMFGKGVKEDWKKGIEMYGKCGKIDDDELGWIRGLSNERYVCGKELYLTCLFFYFMRKPSFLFISNVDVFLCPKYWRFRRMFNS